MLTAFADVDQLVVARALEQQILNRYRAGQVSYSEVVQARAIALNARRSLMHVQTAKAAAVALIQSLGGGWRAG